MSLHLICGLLCTLIVYVNGEWKVGVWSETFFGWQSTLTDTTNSTHQLEVRVHMQTDVRGRIVIQDRSKDQFRPPQDTPEGQTQGLDPIYEVLLAGGPNDKQLDENATKQEGDTPDIIRVDYIGSDKFRTDWKFFSVRNLIYKDNFIQFTSLLPEGSYLYGLGEREFEFLLPDNHNYTIFGQPEAIWGSPQSGHHPFLLNHVWNQHEREFFSLGLLFFNSAPQSFELQPGRLTYTTVGGILEVMFFLGETVENTIQLYHQYIGTPQVPAYWSLGFHQSRRGYATVAKTREVVEKHTELNLPLDVMWNDLDYMNDYKAFTVDPKRFPLNKTQEFIAYLHGQHRRYVAVMNAGISQETNYDVYVDGLKDGVFVDRGDVPLDNDPHNDKAEDLLVNLEFGGRVVFPDFFHPRVDDWWKKWIGEFIRNTMDVDGFWLDRNEITTLCDGQCTVSDAPDLAWTPVDWSSVQWDTEIASLCIKYSCAAAPSKYNKLQWIPREANPLENNTLSMNGRLYRSSTSTYDYFDVKSLYAHYQVKATRRALEEIKGVRPFLLTRASFVGTGKYASHGLGDNKSKFSSMKSSIPGILSLNLFGIPHVGADVGGLDGNATSELMLRWIPLGSFYPFMRNHNSLQALPQELYSFNQNVTDVARKFLILRYRLLPYWYSLFLQVGLYGGTVVRPLFFEFPQDPETFYVDDQFMVGSALLVSPVLRGAATTRIAYLPEGYWYDWFTGERLKPVNNITQVEEEVCSRKCFGREGPQDVADRTSLTTHCKKACESFAVYKVEALLGKVQPEVLRKNYSEPVCGCAIDNKDCVVICEWAEVWFKELQLVEGAYQRFKSPIGTLPLHVRGGSIIPMLNKGRATTIQSRCSGHGLFIALDENGYAHGQLLLDDGESVEIEEHPYIVQYTHLSYRGANTGFLAAVRAKYPGSANNGPPSLDHVCNSESHGNLPPEAEEGDGQQRTDKANGTITIHGMHADYIGRVILDGKSLHEITYGCANQNEVTEEKTEGIKCSHNTLHITLPREWDITQEFVIEWFNETDAGNHYNDTKAYHPGKEPTEKELIQSLPIVAGAVAALLVVGLLAVAIKRCRKQAKPGSPLLHDDDYESTDSEQEGLGIPRYETLGKKEIALLATTSQGPSPVLAAAWDGGVEETGRASEAPLDGLVLHNGVNNTGPAILVDGTDLDQKDSSDAPTKSAAIPVRRLSHESDKWSGFGNVILGGSLESDEKL